MEAENLKRWLRVRVVGRLILQVLNADLVEESLHNTKEVVKADSTIDDNTFDLMEFSQMSGIKGLVSEDTIDGEVLHGLELSLLCLLEKHLGGDSSSVRSQDVLHGFLGAPAWAISERAFKTILVSVADALLVLLGHTVAIDWGFAEESVLEITSGMTLGLEKSIEVPE